jgi:alkanesulfonate monooxygenase SsuD/methylene tetrahydromethanopterin reductase-like flavin-dependent oxidoreductase (luciferase family)
LFYPNARVGDRQRYCGQKDCQAASKKASQARWTRKNPDHFRGGESTERVRAWRAQNPEYWKRPGRTDVAQQDEITSQDAAIKEDMRSSLVSHEDAKQETIRYLLSLFTGLLVLVTGSTQQDEIAQAVSKVLSLAREVGQVKVA